MIILPRNAPRTARRPTGIDDLRYPSAL